MTFNELEYVERLLRSKRRQKEELEKQIESLEKTREMYVCLKR